VQSQLATFFRVFPNGTIWSNDIEGHGYDIVLLGQREATSINVEALQRRLDRDDHLLVVCSLNEVDLGSAESLLDTYAGHGPDLRTWLKDAEVNRDRNLRLQYLAGIGLNAYKPKEIYEAFLAFRRPPADLSGGAGVRKPAAPMPVESQGTTD
jgi:spermidine synthase